MLEIKRFNSFDEIKEIWDQLIRKNSNTTIYQSVKYNELIWNNLFPYRIILRITPVFFVFFRNGSPMLIVPLFKKVMSDTFFVFGDKAGGGYLDFIYDDSLSVDELKNCLKELSIQYNVLNIVVHHVRSNTTLGMFSLKNGGIVSNLPCTAILMPNSYDEYNSSLSKNMRQNIRTAYNRLAKDGLEMNFGFLDYGKLDKKQKLELQSIYINRQTTKYRTVGRSAFSFFVKHVDIGTKAENSLGLEGVFFLKINGEIAAFFDALYDDDNSIIVPRLSIVDHFDRYSPGVLLLNESIKWAIESTNIRKIDLTHGDEKYKIAMGGSVFHCVEGRIKV